MIRQMTHLVASSRALIVALLLCWFAAPAWARYQNGFDVFNGSEGLAPGEIVSIVEDPQGYIWVATHGTIHRFEGERFFRFGPNEGVPGGRIHRLRIDRQGVVRACTSVGILTFAGGRFVREPRFAALNDVAAFDLMEANDGTFWAATSQGVFQISPQGTSRWQVADGLPRQTVLAVAQTKDGSIWMGTDRGIVRLRAGQLTVWTNRQAGLQGDYFTRLLAEQDGSLWVATDAALYHFVDDTFQKMDLGTNKADVYVLDLMHDSQGHLTLATLGEGVLTWTGDSFTHLGLEEGLPSEDIWSITSDSSGGLWIGTAEHGVVRRSQSAFQQLVGAKELAQGVPSSLLETSDGHLWVGTSGAGLLRFELRCFQRARTCAPLTLTERDGLSSDEVRTLTTKRGTNSEIWIGSRKGPTLWNGSVAHIPDRWVSPHPVRGFVEGDDGSILVATKEQGLVKYGPPPAQGEKWEEIHPAGVTDLSDTPHPAPLWSLARGQDNVLWGGAEGGVYAMSDQVSGLAATFFRLIDLAENERVHQLLPDATNRQKLQWFTTETALGWFLRTTDGFTSKAIRLSNIQWVTTVNGMIWAGTESGLLGFDSNDPELTIRASLGASTGYPLAATSAAHAGNTNLYIGSAEGIFRFDPRMQVNDAKINILLTKISANGVTMPAVPAQTLSLPSGKPSVQIDFHAMSYPAPERVELRYRLLGLSNEWGPPTHSRSAYFAALAPGAYELQVQARNGLEWQPLVSAARFEVAQAIWQTLWFRALALSALFLAAPLILLRRSRKLVSDRERLQREVDARTAELRQHGDRLESEVEARTRELQDLAEHQVDQIETERRMIAHDLHDDFGQLLGAIQLELTYLAATQPSATPQDSLQTIARVQGATNELGAKMRSAILRLRPRLLDDLGLVAALEWLCESAPQSGELRIEHDLPEDMACDDRVALCVFRIAQEALSNVIAHAHASEVKIVLRVDDGVVELAVIDNGVGFLSPPTQSRFGLVGMKERARAVGGTLHIDSDGNHGTTILLRAPRDAVRES